MALPRTKIWTIGYQSMTPAAILRYATALDAVVVDCRFNPISRIPGFGRRQLVGSMGDRYCWSGDMLGGRGHTTEVGIGYLRNVKSRVLLMCMEHSPVDCHRHTTICGPHFPNAIHIFEDELITAKSLSHALRYDTDYDVEAPSSLIFE